MSEFLVQAVVYLGAAVLCVPIAKRLGLGSVLGYLLAGIVIGPFVLGFVGEEGEDIMHFAEFGVVMMLFLVGLELEPAAFWRMRRTVLGAGLAQVGLTAAVFALTGSMLGLSWPSAIAVGCALAMSSTAIALQALKEKHLMGTAAGQHSFAVLLFQDVAVIPMLALLPLLAAAPATADAAHGTGLGALPGWMQTAAVLGAVAAVVGAGRWVIVPLLRVVARTRLRELFTASALLIVVGIALLMQVVGLSAALGTFLAGLVLATSEFKHELESDLDPFKGLLLGLFFMAVGASIDFHLIAAAPGWIALLTIGVMVIKLAILAGIGRAGGLSVDQTLMFGVGLSQVGEFAFVLAAFAGQLGLLAPDWMATLMAVTALSMTVTPLGLLLNERVILPRVGTRVRPVRAADTPQAKHPVILAGFSHFGSVDLLRRMGFNVYYGDATRHDLLEAAGAAEARILVSAVEDPQTAHALVRTARKHFPHLAVMTRARHRYDAYELMDLGVSQVYRQHQDTSVRLGVDILRQLGHRAYSAYRAGQQFLRYDEAAMTSLAATRHNMSAYITSVRQQIAHQEALLLADRELDPTSSDRAWDSEELRTRLTATRG
jgi:CPA2 family monovalent cation:H+ antiporter-2